VQPPNELLDIATRTPDEDFPVFPVGSKRALSFALVSYCSGRSCAMGLEGIVSKGAISPYKSGPSKFFFKTRNVVETQLILLGTEGKPIAFRWMQKVLRDD
jgi:hypothetical protein